MELEKVNLYRIVHIENVAYILKNGMFCVGHPSFDPDNIFIGDSVLTGQRHEHPIPLAGYGNVGDYVPFYLGYRSPMLFNIQTGYRGVKKQAPAEIVYIVCKLKGFVEKGYTYVFTDGHAKNRLTRFFTDVSDLKELNWESISALRWNNTPNNPDRMRQKQAECLIKSEVTPDYIVALVVYDESSKIKVENIVKEVGLGVRVFINPSQIFYF